MQSIARIPAGRLAGGRGRNERLRPGTGRSDGTWRRQSGCWEGTRTNMTQRERDALRELRLIVLRGGDFTGRSPSEESNDESERPLGTEMFRKEV